jgi:hypothetical protein
MRSCILYAHIKTDHYSRQYILVNDATTAGPDDGVYIAPLFVELDSEFGGQPQQIEPGGHVIPIDHGDRTAQVQITV